ncbi:MAG: hypothetical protein ACOC31_03325 [Bacteroidota bacterium]
MIKRTLLKTAGNLAQPSVEAAKEFEEKQDFIVHEMNTLMNKRPDLKKLIGENNSAMMEDNHRNQYRFFVSLFRDYNPDTLVETVLWVYRAYRSHGFRLTYWPAQLDQWLGLFKAHFSEKTYAEIYPFYHWMIIHQASFASLTDDSIT